MSIAKPKIAISACLLGEPVHFNAGHKESPLCSRILANHFDLVPLCPEMAIGLDMPRQPTRLVGDPASPRAVGTAGELGDLDGFIFMQKTPSCGLERVKVYRDDGQTVPGGARGLFAAAFCARRPDLPVEEDGRLHDPVLRENFITRVFVHADWRQLLGRGLSRQAILDFHARHKYLLMASHPQQYRALGRLLGEIGQHAPEEFGPRYLIQLMAALRQCASRGSHGNVLQHLCGYLRPALNPDERKELQRLIEQYRLGILPLVVPLTLLKHHFRRHPHPYVARQVYLQPHPEELGLRNLNHA
ncbi:2-thiouracil desulfurase family protein [Azotobacter armeniacus]